MFISGGPGMQPDELERKLYVLRNYTVRVCLESVSNIGDDFYINSMSYKTVVYKGQLTTEQVPQYFLDLQNPTMVTALALVHSRFLPTPSRNGDWLNLSATSRTTVKSTRFAVI